MRKIAKPFWAVFLMTVFSSSAAQAFFIEPIVGYSLATYETGSQDDTNKAIYAGGRLGLGLPMVPLLWFAADVGTTLNGEYEDKSAANEVDSTQFLAGASVGFNIPVIPVFDRIWVTYNFIDKLSFENATDQKLTGSSVKFGLGLKLLPLISINAEYIIGNYDEQELSAVTTAINTDYKAWLFTLSLPLP